MHVKLASYVRLAVHTDRQADIQLCTICGSEVIHFVLIEYNAKQENRNYQMNIKRRTIRTASDSALQTNNPKIRMTMYHWIMFENTGLVRGVIPKGQLIGSLVDYRVGGGCECIL